MDVEHKDKEAWAEWITGYGADKFLDDAIIRLHGAVSVCDYCERTITLDAGIGTGGVFDWHDDGDYGCDDSPETTEEGCGSHRARGTEGY